MAHFTIATATEYCGGGWIFWIIVAFFILRGCFTTSEDEKKSQKSASKTGAEWKNIPRNTQKKRENTQSETERRKRKTFEGLYASSPTGYASPESSADFAEVAGTGGNSDAMVDLIPLYEAAGRGKLMVAQRKLEGGANVNETDSFFGETPLHRAAKVGDRAMTDLLLRYGADVTASTNYGDTPLHFAITGRNPDVIRLLLEYGADPDAKDIFGRTPKDNSRFYSELSALF